MEKYSKIALLLFKPHRSRYNILQQFNSFTDAFSEFGSSAQYKNSQAGRILSNMQLYYAGKRRAQKIRTENLDNWSLGNQADSESECSDREGDGEKSREECNNDDQGDCFADDARKYSSKLGPEALEKHRTLCS